MSLTGVTFRKFSNRDALIAGLSNDNMERFSPPPKTVMINSILDKKDPFRWLIVDDTYPAQIAERIKLLETWQDYFVDRLDTPGVTAAEIELRDTVVSYLLENYPTYFTRENDLILSRLGNLSVDVGPNGADPLVAVALLASEDLEILLPTHRDKNREVFTFQSGALLFANGWSLRSMFNQTAASDATQEDIEALEEAREASLYSARLGKSLSEIHNPVVQEYMKKFTGGDAFFQALAPGRFYWRRNWLPHLGTTLCRHPDLEIPTVSLENKLESWNINGKIRSEHETFIKLPKSGAVIFGIKTFCWPVTDMVANPKVRAALLTANNNMSADMQDYHSHNLPSFRRWLAASTSDQQDKATPVSPPKKSSGCPFHPT